MGLQNALFLFVCYLFFFTTTSLALRTILGGTFRYSRNICLMRKLLNEWTENLSALNLNLVPWVFIEHSDFLNRNIDFMKMKLERDASYLSENAKVKANRSQNQLLWGCSKKHLKVEKNFCQIWVQGGM